MMMMMMMMMMMVIITITIKVQSYTTVQQTEMDPLRTILHLYVNKGLQIVCNRKCHVSA
jgi:hypothetical protein